VLNTSDLARVPQDVTVYRVTDAFTVRGIVLDGFSSSHNKSGWAELGPGLYTGHNLEHAQMYDETVSGGIPAVMGLRLKRPANGLLVNDTGTTNDRKAGGLQHVIEGYDFLSDGHGAQVKFHPRFFHEHLEVDHVRVRDRTGEWTKYEPSEFVAKFEEHIVGQHKQKAAESNANQPPPPERPTEQVPDLVDGEPPRDASPSDLAMIRYSEEAARFETRLAEYLAARSDVKQQVQRLVQAAWDHATPAQRRRFGTNQTSVTGMVGPEAAALEKVVTSGNLREQMALLYNGYTSKTFETMLGSRFDRPTNLLAEREKRSATHEAAPILKQIDDIHKNTGLSNEEKKQQLQPLNRALEKTRRTQELASQVGPPLSDAEWFSAVDREGSLGWHPGSRLYQMKLDTELQQDAHGTGGLVWSGTSGTAHGLMSVALTMAEKWNVEVDPDLVRLALVATMIAAGDHTYHEILRGVELADPNFTYLDNWGRYWHLPPVSEAELRAHVAETGLFPDEHARSVPPTN
jgi:hypothetical protein